MGATVGYETITALAVTKAKQKSTDLHIEDISALFAKARQGGLPIEKVALRRVPGGFYSEDVEAFIGRLLAANYATARSPIDVHQKGLDVCMRIIEQEIRDNGDLLHQVAKSLDLDEALPGPSNPAP